MIGWSKRGRGRKITRGRIGENKIGSRDYINFNLFKVLLSLNIVCHSN